jgi:Subtilase family
MKWFFTPPAERSESRQQAGNYAPGLLDLPDELLQRHGALVLDPGRAERLSGDVPPRHTVYRANTLLVPGDVLQMADFAKNAGTILAKIGLRLVTPGGQRSPVPGRDDRQVFALLRRLPRTVVLAPLPDFERPVVVDAWYALQTLRTNATGPDLPGGFAEAVGRITLEHLLVGSAITGSPVGGWTGGVTGGSGPGSGGPGPGSTDSYLFSGGDPRMPVAVLAGPPARRPDDVCEPEFGRRPVVAVVDTGVRAQPHLDVAPDGAGGYVMPPDGFTMIDDAIQAAIRADGLAASEGPRQVIQDAFDRPMTANPLIGECNEALGHSTFIAGILRQVVPDARVLAIRALNSDDVAYEGDIICALAELALRIAYAEEDDLTRMVDVVSLSFGYFSESAYDATVTSGLWTAIQALLSVGVVVVAAAGNFATSREFYPAAFAQEPVPAPQVPVISVGALNPDGTKAMFSNDADWVTAWAQGACVVSTYPVDVDGGRTPELRDPVNRRPPAILPPGREALDPDDFTDGWAIWSGTSFSAPYLAALITRAMLRRAAADSSLRLDVPGEQAAADRAASAVAMLHEEEQRWREQEARRAAERNE